MIFTRPSLLNNLKRFASCSRNIVTQTTFRKPVLLNGSGRNSGNILLKRFAATENLTPDILRKQKIVGYWLAGCAGLTFATVCVGGITRLTESGLSMVDWHPFKEVPPSTQEEWEAEFEKYKQYPEFKVKNKEITLEQFKFIWHMEWGHRTLGRTIGACYFLPMALFW